MKNRYTLAIFFLATLFCSACSRAFPKKVNAHAEYSSSVKDDKLAVAGITNLDTAFKPNKKETPYRGQLVGAVHWNDKRGENIIIISKTTDDYDWQQEYPEMKKFVTGTDDINLVDIFATHFIYNDSLQRWKKYWFLHDFQFTCCDLDVKYLPSSLFIEDIDGDGRAESSFSYCFGGGPDLYYELKVILHHDSLKLKVEGTAGKDKQFLGLQDSPEKYFGDLLKNSLYMNWAKKTWISCSQLQLQSDSLESIKRKKDFEISIKDDILNLARAGDSAFRAKNYCEAYKNYSAFKKLPLDEYDDLTFDTRHLQSGIKKLLSINDSCRKCYSCINEEQYKEATTEGWNLYNKRKFKEAISKYEYALLYKPGDKSAIMWLGYCDAALKKENEK